MLCEKQSGIREFCCVAGCEMEVNSVDDVSVASTYSETGTHGTGKSH